MTDRDSPSPQSNGSTNGITPEFRLRLLEVHQAVQDALLRPGSSLLVELTDDEIGDPMAPQAALTIHDAENSAGEDVSIDLRLDDDRTVRLRYPRNSLHGMPSDILVWALLRDLQMELD